ncbi:MAG: hypothetical protein K0R14_2071 [Burkholderiales bacterium]|jgi:hypothetical protein|nr:hypothetical protein [Burkholderiales bacterium]
MKDNHRIIDDKTIGELTLPGTHLANAYNIKGSESLCVGESIDPKNMSINATLQHVMQESKRYNRESFVAYLNTQKEDINHQLSDGIRYIELQVCGQNNSLYTSNIYLTDKLDNILTSINDYVNNHSGEIIILDLDNNLWADYGKMNARDATLLYNHIITIIGHSLVPKSMFKNSVGQLKKAGKQIILLSSNPQLATFPFVWDKTMVAITPQAGYSTVQKIETIQNMYKKDPELANIISIMPLYSELPAYNIDNGISSTNQDDPLILNYLSQTLANHAMIIVTDYKHLDAIIDLSIPNNQTTLSNQYTVEEKPE